MSTPRRYFGGELLPNETGRYAYDLTNSIYTPIILPVAAITLRVRYACVCLRVRFSTPIFLSVEQPMVPRNRYESVNASSPYSPRTPSPDVRFVNLIVDYNFDREQ